MHTTPTPTMPPNGKQLVDYFSRALSAFQSSPERLRVLCTLPHETTGRPDDGTTTARPRARRPSGRVVVRRLVVVDSSFNPPTRAHAAMARSAMRKAAELGPGQGTRMVLLLAVNNADKAPQPASMAVRLGMMEAFARELLAEHDEDDGGENGKGGGGGGAFEVDVTVTKMPYFHDKARAITDSGWHHAVDREEEATVPEQVFVLGFDTLVRVFDPKYYDGGEEGMRAALDPFFEGARLRVTLRPDGSWGPREEQLAYVRSLADADGGRKGWAARVDVEDEQDVEMEMAGVSSSRVRQLVKRSGGVEELDGLVGDEVKAWIDREGLYQE